MNLETVNPISLSPVTDTVASWQWLEAQTPIDFTETLEGQGWSAEFLIENCGTVAFREAVTLAADGGISITIPQATSAALRSARRIDAFYQIRFTAPLPEMDEVWRGPVIVLEITA